MPAQLGMGVRSGFFNPVAPGPMGSLPSVLLRYAAESEIKNISAMQLTFIRFVWICMQRALNAEATYP